MSLDHVEAAFLCKILCYLKKEIIRRINKGGNSKIDILFLLKLIRHAWKMRQGEGHISAFLVPSGITSLIKKRIKLVWSTMINASNIFGNTSSIVASYTLFQVQLLRENWKWWLHFLLSRTRFNLQFVIRIEFDGMAYACAGDFLKNLCSSDKITNYRQVWSLPCWKQDNHLSNAPMFILWCRK